MYFFVLPSVLIKYILSSILAINKPLTITCASITSNLLLINSEVVVSLGIGRDVEYGHANSQYVDNRHANNN